jgi:NadR type nicotinamide-nucleotide adenylyltransferase
VQHLSTLIGYLDYIGREISCMAQNPTIQKTSIKRVGILGPECTGKTELSSFLADHFNTCWVAEYARNYLDNLPKPYEQSDLIKIAHGQIRLEDEWMSEANGVLICDTTLHVIKIWSEFKFGNCDPEILQLMAQRDYDLFLLTYIDIPWQEDPQREHPGKRELLWSIYKEEMALVKNPVVIVKGGRDERRKIAMDSIQDILN